MTEDGVHGVARLLSRDTQVLLQGAGDAGEDRLGGFVGIHGDAGSFGLVRVEPLDVSKSFFSGSYQPCPSLFEPPFVFILLVKSFIVAEILLSKGG